LGETIRLANGGSESESSWSSYSGSESGDEIAREEEQGGASLKKDAESISTQRTTDGEGDIAMTDTLMDNDTVDKGKGKEVENPVPIDQKDTEMQSDNVGASSTDATVVGSASVSGSDPSGGDSVHTVHSSTS
jgi:hypothetical protein